MIVGDGLIAKAFAEFRGVDDVVIFASGVSNSTETDPAEFHRERDLLKDTIEGFRDKRLIYFSTCSLGDPSLSASPYIVHKAKMEEFVTANSPRFVIFRVSNIVGPTPNPHTLMNYLVGCIATGREFKLWKNAFRNFIDIDDVVSIVSDCLKRGSFDSEIVNVANPTNVSVIAAVQQIERFIGKKALYSAVDQGGSPEIDTTAIEAIIKPLGLVFDDQYLEKLLHKYYETARSARQGN